MDAMIAQTGEVQQGGVRVDHADLRVG